MDIKTISVAFVAIMVGAVAFGAMLPIFQDVTATEDIFINKGYYDMTYTSVDDITLSWDRTTPDKITVNDEIIDLLPPDVGKSRTIVCGDDWIVRYWRSGSIFGVEYTGSSGAGTSANSSGNNNFSLIATNGNVTITGSSTLTNTYTYLYCIAKNGPYVMKNANESAFMNGDSLIYAMGNTSNMPVSGTTVYLKTTGTIDDGLNTTVFRTDGTTETITAGTPVLTDSEVNGYIDLYKLDQFTVDITDGTNTGTVTYSYFIVPAEVTAERAIHGDSGFNTIVNLIPLVIGMGLLLIAVWWFVVRKF